VKQNKNIGMKNFFNDFKNIEQDSVLEDDLDVTPTPSEINLDATSESDDVDLFRTLNWSINSSFIEC